MKKITILKFKYYKEKHYKFSAITAYDYSFVSLFKRNPVKAILVGDSLNMVVKGNKHTISTNLRDIIYHLKCIRATGSTCLIIADLPYICVNRFDSALKSSTLLLKYGANIVKIEERENCFKSIIKRLVLKAIPVCGHIGLTPQYVNIISSYVIQGRDSYSSELLIDSSIWLERYGVHGLIIECVVSYLVQKLLQLLAIPIVGIGAGPTADGQILVVNDIIGILDNIDKLPFFVKIFIKESKTLDRLVHIYSKSIEKGFFPNISNVIP
ncbi:3-methyl-2-oxobutanoate hydroxymethyltransferase [Candidatus Tremblaya phenacola]|uniref:3-methyl-2-oxobutanoate hydroxymethyltransferase n=1 Tax=Candidatus Tremblayella phenacoccinincola TaxID=1010676 RepID=A0A2G0V755_9PROT|nr:3-methyl-2-oxobutanoate hydroxymethyltransferase [Candidatus Tremblaya phenacola]PHN16299.1 3-methyl-2-oxobutanoate hydroxymethyltransferase [Candidatus Tremblaya phenacola]